MSQLHSPVIWRAGHRARAARSPRRSVAPMPRRGFPTLVIHASRSVSKARVAEMRDKAGPHTCAWVQHFFHSTGQCLIFLKAQSTSAYGTQAQSSQQNFPRKRQVNKPKQLGSFKRYSYWQTADNFAKGRGALTTIELAIFVQTGANQFHDFRRPCKFRMGSGTGV